MNSQLVDFLDNEQMLNAKQYGFRTNKFTSLALIKFTDQVLEAMNRGNSVLDIFLDFSKAFDTIDHSILLNKLKVLNFSNISVNVFFKLPHKPQTTYYDGCLILFSDINYNLPFFIYY